jgi:excinuclease ABC subunit C
MSVRPLSSEHLSGLPTRPGVYLFKGEREEVLYVGKAKSLRARVRSYFRSDGATEVKTRELVRRIRDVETIVVGSEAEALILEANLIKEHAPRFNIQLKDDKRYPYIKVTTGEPFPRVFVTRNTVNDGSRYFGPYTSVGYVRRALQVVKRLYTVRSCRYDLPDDAPSRPCLDYHIGRCQAPCVGLQSESEYGSMIEEIIQILEGDTEAVRRQVDRRMREAADRLDFEIAARHRDVMQGLDTLAREQRVHKLAGGDYDVLGLARDGSLGTAVVLRVRKGRLIGRDTHRFSGLDREEDAELMSSFASRYYLGRGESGTADLPREVLLPHAFEDSGLLESVLSEAATRRVRLVSPKRGEKRKLVGLANENARHALEDRIVQTEGGLDRADRTLYDLQDRLDLKVVPRLIVCFDISHLQGAETVASAVVFENGEPRKSEYRRMKIRGDWGNDDFQSIQEAVFRYFRRRIEERLPLPDLVLIDGGRGQLTAARSSLVELDLAHVAVAALAKKEEEVFLPGRAQPVRIERRYRALHLLQRIRDEAHRFAVSYNRKLRRKRTLRSDLGDIPGIGPERQRALLERFGSVKGIKAASEQEIARVPGFSHVLASRILTYLGT